MNEQRDYSLLRLFDMDAAMAGAPLAWGRTALKCRFLGESKNTPNFDNRGAQFCIEHEGGLAYSYADDLFMAPLCWVEGRPVYRGDVLYHPRHGEGKVIEDRRYCGGAAIKYEAAGTAVAIDAPYFYDGLTWTPPKTVTRQVKLLAYLDADQLFWLRETAHPKWPATRVPFEDRTVEIEEPLEKAS